MREKYMYIYIYIYIEKKRKGKRNFPEDHLFAAFVSSEGLLYIYQTGSYLWISCWFWWCSSREYDALPYGPHPSG
jgi:hypothetical protein